MKKTVLLYNFEETELAKARRALLPLKFAVKAVKKEEYHLSVGYLTGLTDEQDKKEGDIEEFGRLVVMGGFLSSEIDKLLAALRKAGFGRDVLKAVITPTNASWSGKELYEEIHKEHKLMQK